ncbi:MAG TPA: glycoside hydrolase family 15 protein [Trueperaceae bacterium]
MTYRGSLPSTSLQIIRDAQTSEGAYLASPAFPTYHYCWFRDGAFIATAMDAWGEHDSAAAFHAWAIRTLLRHAPERQVRCDEPFGPSSLFHTRYCADGSPGTDAWPNFQLDGFGTWLWAYQRHVEQMGQCPGEDGCRAVRLVADYLQALWPRPNFDCWEEFPDDVHPSTLAASQAGLKAAALLLGEPHYQGAAEAVRAYLLTHGVHDGHFVKHIGADTVDANLLWLAVPYKVVPANHPIARATATRIRDTLQDPDGGVHRYATDSYYGGGSWILLTAALAQDHLAVGEVEEARRLCDWIEAQATPEGYLPEQVAHYMNHAPSLGAWQKRWGPVACPLLWSHASYLSLVRSLEEAG